MLECALEAEADVIVSGGHHLLDMQQFREILQLFQPEDFSI